MRKVIALCLILCCMFSLCACSKDEIVEQYNEALQAVGDNNLTNNKDLQVTRQLGEDSYVGTYQADYDDFTGKEIVFGGTSLERDAGNEINISCDLQITDGTVKLLLQTGDSDPQILSNEDGSYSDTIELPAASNYIVIESENFTGTVNLTIK